MTAHEATGSDDHHDETDDDVRLPWQLWAAIGLICAQAVALIGLGLIMALKTVTGEAQFLSAAIGEIVVVLGVATLLLYLAKRLRGRHASARGLSVFMGLLWLPIGWFLHQAGLTDWTFVAWAIAVTQTVLLVVAPTREALGVETRLPMAADIDEEPDSETPKG
ncbi:hypothetical protein [Natronoglycomyces albus]|uniref:Integral membrane protein n=1 Tax=Natronoglycomyces albus TaxID=2811108 RepID=A0A895XHM7_9ACTN|nr:hypothetical protein [Natronoglycomyces albus]QSB04437.1 hypothetical protein JQS30_11635 [Natronoglycomyces albus]